MLTSSALSTSWIGLATPYVPLSLPAKCKPTTFAPSLTTTDPESPWSPNWVFCAVSASIPIWLVSVTTPRPLP